MFSQRLRSPDALQRGESFDQPAVQLSEKADEGQEGDPGEHEQAAEAAKSLDPKKVAAQIKSGQKFNTVIGQLSYDKKGDVTRIDYTVYVWKKDPSGKITYTEIE